MFLGPILTLGDLGRLASFTYMGCHAMTLPAGTIDGYLQTKEGYM